MKTVTRISSTLREEREVLRLRCGTRVERVVVLDEEDSIVEERITMDTPS